MVLDADQFIDRRRIKRRLAFWRVTAIAALVVAVVVAVGRISGLDSGDHIARLAVSGIILDDPLRDEVLAGIVDDGDVKGLIVRIDSSGGTVVGGEALYLGLRAVAAEKPVVAVMGEMATSAAYMTALGADHILARAGSVTGSIGVLLQTADIRGLLKMLGVEPISIKSAPLKAQPSPLEPFTPEAREAVTSMVMDLFDLFVDMVAERRQLTREEALKLADGRVYTGRQAVKVGLVDGLGGEEEARRWMEENREIEADLPVRDLEIEREDPLWRQLLQGAVGKTLFPERLRLDGLISLWHPDLG